MKKILASPMRFSSVVAAAALVACSAAHQGPDEEPNASTTQQDPLTLSVTPIATTTTNAPIDKTCPTVNPTCTLTPFIASDFTGFAKALYDTHDCGTFYHYKTNNPDDYQHIGITLCNDTTAVRTVSKPGMWPNEQPRILTSICDACLAPATAGKIYVEWKTPFWGPTCGSSCSMPWCCG
jgi:hypothetical protein